MPQKMETSENCRNWQFVSNTIVLQLLKVAKCGNFYLQEIARSGNFSMHEQSNSGHQILPFLQTRSHN